MVRVYVATEGSYSDYRVLGVFAKEADAKEASHDQYLTMDVYPAMPPAVQAYRMWADPFDGEVHTESYHDLYPWDYRYEFFAHDRPRVEVNARNGKGPNKYEGRFDRPLLLTVSGTDPKAVQQAFSDRRGQLLAEREGIA